ncbi:9647_t:CDS:1, partial [Paraglomus brasilianum]
MRSILACSNASTCIETGCEELVGASNDSGIEDTTISYIDSKIYFEEMSIAPKTRTE